MNNNQKKMFRIEKTMREAANSSAKRGTMFKPEDVTDEDARFAILLKEMRSLREEMSNIQSITIEKQQEEVAPTKEVIDDYKQQIIDANNLRNDLKELSDAIEATKVEIAALRADTQNDDKIHVASMELSAVVNDTEVATDGIIEAAETIETLADRLRVEINDASQIEVLDEIAERVIKIFESCNFQDITGQRITKVVNTMNFIDERIHGMMEIWGGKELFAELTPEAEAEQHPEGDRLHGPALPGASISQDEIDALFD
ncbi:hypothetical protein [Curvivirga aplysinae]|uniref:hypothetical protein n=1 Tax=Curvivirga aplysinae TaxID=2529852 RepID=UPI0012BB9747|nr:hypothetical protein [Curvivirga aplysinae]MTI08512.1 hypothetical protein [Curvivirga aplysinae]